MYKCLRPVALAMLVLSLPVSAEAADSFDLLKYAFAGGTPNLDLRLRYENVEQDNALEEATAYTVRTRLGYTTGKWNNFDLQVELEDVHALGDEDYNSCPGALSDSCNRKTQFSVIGDPADTELNQFWLRYSGIPGTVLKYGRQRLALDNHRFIGTVGWRQNEQTFDAASIVNTSLPKTTITYAYLNDVNGIFFNDFRMGSHLLNVGFAASPKFNLTGYGYLLDFELDVPARRDTQTLGLRATGAVPFSAVQFLYTLEYADQGDYKDSPSTVDASYALVELGAGSKYLTGKLGYEVLGGDGVFGFQTPLATLHAFQGWADLFLNTPATGVQDAYLSLGGPLAGFNWLAVYHQFSPDTSGDDYGDEIDLQVARPINDNFSVLLKYADYSADAFAVDTKKLWVQAEYKF